MLNHQQSAVRIINLDEVIFRTSLGKTTIYQLQKIGKFPRGVSLGGTRSTGLNLFPKLSKAVEDSSAWDFSSAPSNLEHGCK